ncbi:hypothetical protein ASPZODRAFT_73899 [Penicilliopsis zonata CBS 506.65]|uniref:Actin binding protein n=1 Tax=Penicilliopsis zonata CBS 506.65 TaxID=1073090 RepID=A0A1L9S960_9EURO|nr:hypothetical protein ASPZODRAFT_73899 [Penicilliopsis zonata CBS 506.65]OJJ43701.1 hypothetical protein ASPZODRAFT_73899 [Penicilliopsis zonata CBS 506.65]
MATLNLSSNGPSISKSYQHVLNAPNLPTDSPTYGQWAVFAVSTPLVNAFQSAANKESILKVQSTGEGELVDLIDEFSEGRIQFAYVKIKDMNTGLPKQVLIAWCGEGVPERTKGYFTSHLSAVSKFLHGFHVQITARSDRDLSPESIIQKVADASGAKYSVSNAPPQVDISSKPQLANTSSVFTAKRAGGITHEKAPVRNTPSTEQKDPHDDGWGPDAPPISRTGLEKVKPAYQPTRVNMQELKSVQTETSRMGREQIPTDRDNVVKGGYRPIGKVDIAAIRRQARETGQLKDDRPEPVKGAYEPVGKVDIAVIRARAHKPSDVPVDSSYELAGKPTTIESEPTSERSTVTTSSSRLTSLPKPKVSSHLKSTSPFTKAGSSDASGFATQSTPSTAPVGAASRTFADEGGKTPAQLWAERKAKERAAGALDSPPTVDKVIFPAQGQPSDTKSWKSSYTGKSWAPVQTTHIAKSMTDEDATTIASNLPHKDVGVEGLALEDNTETLPENEDTDPKPSDIEHNIPLPELSARPVEPEISFETATAAVVPTPPQQPRSPTPPTPPVEHESSPIRVAIPVGRGVSDAHEEQYSPPPAMPIRSLEEVLPETSVHDEPVEDMGRETAEALTGDLVAQPSGIRALVQYDYEKAEDNEIDLKEGEFVTDIEMVDEDWWLGVNISGERGLFPSNYVEVVESGRHTPDLSTQEHKPELEEQSLPVPTAPSDESTDHGQTTLSNGPTATAIYDYEAAEDNEISFNEGAKIVNIEFPDDDWWLGEFEGKTGLFPANYVQLDD